MMSQIGCSTLRDTPRQAQLRSCIENFINKSVAPKSALILCKNIYKVMR